MLVRATGLASSISGVVRNARDNAPIAGAAVILYRGQGAQTSGVIDTTSDAQGRFSFTNQNTGTYTLETAPLGYSSCSRTAIALPAASAIIQDVTCSPAGFNQIRVVLTWGANPSDLDAHLTGPTADASRFHVFYPPSSRGSGGASPFAVLDVDDTSSFGPETITIAEPTGQSSRSFRGGTHEIQVIAPALASGRRSASGRRPCVRRSRIRKSVGG